jgi:hypothetical protein
MGHVRMSTQVPDRIRHSTTSACDALMLLHMVIRLTSGVVIGERSMEHMKTDLGGLVELHRLFSSAADAAVWHQLGLCPGCSRMRVGEKILAPRFTTALSSAFLARAG